MNPDTLEALRSGHPRAVARALSEIERGGDAARGVIAAIFRYTGRARVVGITGSPGTGKSTLVNEMAKTLRRRDLRVGIIAVDPTSPFTGGAILGDRLRMRDLTGDPGVFIRSMATRGHLGGITAATADAIKVLDVAGFDVVIVETVGAGQSEVDIARNAHTTVVVQAPGLGDDIQAIKAGILEIADVLVVNKADRDGANATFAALEMNLNLKPRVAQEWRPPVLKTVALQSQGIDAVVDSVDEHHAFLVSNGLLAMRERARLRAELEFTLERDLMARIASTGDHGLDGWVERIAARELDVYQAARLLLAAL